MRTETASIETALCVGPGRFARRFTTATDLAGDIPSRIEVEESMSIAGFVLCLGSFEVTLIGGPATHHVCSLRPSSSPHVDAVHLVARLERDHVIPAPTAPPGIDDVVAAFSPLLAEDLRDGAEDRPDDPVRRSTTATLHAIYKTLRTVGTDRRQHLGPIHRSLAWAPLTDNAEKRWRLHGAVRNPRIAVAAEAAGMGPQDVEAWESGFGLGPQHLGTVRGLAAQGWSATEALRCYKALGEEVDGAYRGVDRAQVGAVHPRAEKAVRFLVGLLEAHGRGHDVDSLRMMTAMGADPGVQIETTRESLMAVRALLSKG